MKNIYQKLKYWYRGKHIPYSMQEIVDLSRPRYREELKPLPDNFDPPLLARIINPLWHFWLKHWKWLLGFVVSFIALYIAYLKL